MRDDLSLSQAAACLVALPFFGRADARLQTQIALFRGDRLPHRPYCTNHLDAGIYPRGLDQALRSRYLQANPPCLRFRFVFDVDRRDAVFAAEDANLAAPNWIAQNRANGHVHIAYEIETPICTTEHARREPLRLAAAIEYAYQTRLRADSGYSGLICKNPLNNHWCTTVQRQQPYDLSELAEWVELPKRIPRRDQTESPLGRNCSLFDDLRLWSYKNRRHYATRAEWDIACLQQACNLNCRFTTPLAPTETLHIARSVSKWTWARFSVASSDAKFSATQARRGASGGHKSGVVRQINAMAVAEQAKALRAQGLTIRAIAEKLDVAVGSVSKWCSSKP